MGKEQQVAEEKPNVSKEEQAQYDEFVTNAMTLMNNKDGSKQLLESIEGSGNPVEGLANTVVTIITRVEDSAEKNGTEVNPDVLMHGGKEVLEQAADLSEQMGGHAFSEEELEQAMYLAMDLYRDDRGEKGKIDQGKAGAEMQDLQAREQDGSLEAAVPGFTEHAANAQQPPADTGPAPPQRGLLE